LPRSVQKEGKVFPRAAGDALVSLTGDPGRRRY
jgi:hypothetical protein